MYINKLPFSSSTVCDFPFFKKNYHDINKDYVKDLLELSVLNVYTQDPWKYTNSCYGNLF